MNKFKHKFKINTAANILSVLLGVIAPLLIIPILTRDIGIGGYGEYVTIVAFCALFNVFCDLGLGMYIPKKLSLAADNTSLQSQYITVYLFIKIIFSIICCVAILFFSQEYLMMKILIISIITLNNINMSCVLNGTEDYRFLATLNLSSKFFLVAMILYLDFTTNGVEKALFAYAFSLLFIVTVQVGFLYGIKQYAIIFITMSHVKNVILGAKGFFVARLFVNIYTQGSTYIVSLFLTSESVAIYSIGLQLYKVGQAIIGSISRVLYTTMVRTKDYALLWKTTIICLVLHLTVFPIVVVLGDELLSLIFDFNTDELHSLSVLLYMSLFFVIVSSFWGYPALSPINKDRFAHQGIFFSSGVYFIVLGVLILIGEFSILEAVMSIVVADLVGMLLRIYFANKFISKEKVKSDNV